MYMVKVVEMPQMRFELIGISSEGQANVASPTTCPRESHWIEPSDVQRCKGEGWAGGVLVGSGRSPHRS